MSFCVLLDNSDTSAVFYFEWILLIWSWCILMVESYFESSCTSSRKCILFKDVLLSLWPLNTPCCRARYTVWCLSVFSLTPCFIVVLPLFWLGLPCLPSWKLLPVVSAWSCSTLPCWPICASVFVMLLNFFFAFFPIVKSHQSPSYFTLILFLLHDKSVTITKHRITFHRIF